MAVKNFSTRKLLSIFQLNKPMSSPTMFLSLTLIILSISFSSGDNHPNTSTNAIDNLSAYQVLQQYGFPMGLLPQGVIDYDINPDTGEFATYFNGSCSFTIESYKIKCKSTITGVISKEKIENLKGISVKVLLFWINIVKVTREDNEIEFSVGIASASFPVDNFLESPQCGCGLDCNQLEKGADDQSSSLMSS